MFFKKTWGIFVTEDIALSVLHTAKETSLISEYITLKLILFIIFIGIVPAVFVCLVKVSNVKCILPNIILFIGLLLATLGLMYMSYNISNKEGNKHVLAPNVVSFSRYTPVDLIYNGRQAISAMYRLKNASSLSGNYEYDLQNTEDDLKIIFILNETIRADRLSINGYERDTTPHLKKFLKNPNFINFNSVESCGNMTYASTVCLFSRMNYYNYSAVPPEKSVTDVLKSKGFKINVISAQHMIKVYAYLEPDTLISQVNVLERHDVSNAKILDEYLLPIVKEKFESEKGKAFYLIQLMGAHYIFNQRYPSDFAKWKPDMKDTPEEKNNAYDNAILYSDFIVSEIIKLAESEKAIIFFTSDHGESLGENGRWYHGRIGKEEAPEQYAVPFFTYLTPKFANTKKGKAVLQALKSHVNDTNLSHDSLFHTILGCVGFINKNQQKPLIDETLNLCNKAE